MATTKGNCFLCGKTLGKTAIKNYIVKEHSVGDEPCWLVKAEGVYDRNMWLLFSVSKDASLLAVDKFLRQIWCECCGHMSAFSLGGNEFGKARKLTEFAIGNSLLYEYDFGSTTEIALTFVDEIARPKQKEKIRLIARNEPPVHTCDKCDSPATQIDAWEQIFLCDNCVKDVEDEAALLPLVNSPRRGECGYIGEQDKWTFDPSKIKK
ncbi:hypothetical protein FACS1894188_06570 [Clostridia bacterium]|nr:hypothetical protein FACS1894188_06570 [Clostridia bacterium]